tara:strand:+ start:956 stop:1513 length:558 start_codon:yes stop_codon:yes gene_type:complete
MEVFLGDNITTMFSNRVNICGLKDIVDPNYRYKRDVEVLKYEGKGNGKKTRFINIDEISKQLHRTSDELTRFLGIDLSTSTKYTDNVAIINGHIRQHDMEKSLRKYIEIFVLCKQCGLPEIPRYKIDGKKIKTKCLSCGYRDKMDSTDHRLVSFIISKIKDEKGSKNKNKDKKKKKEKEKEKEKA